MQYAPTETANAALAIVINLLDALKDKGLLEENERSTVLAHAMNDLKANTTGNNDARRVINEIRQTRYGRR